jgi:hypothetical protein
LEQVGRCRGADRLESLLVEQATVVDVQAKADLEGTHPVGFAVLVTIGVTIGALLLVVEQASPVVLVLGVERIDHAPLEVTVGLLAALAWYKVAA